MTVVINAAGWEAILTAAPVASAVADTAAGIASAVAYEPHEGQVRAITHTYTTTGMRTNRAAARVVVIHPGAVGIEAKRGPLRRAARASGGRFRPRKAA